ncbi:MAG: protoporphyrinogen oxidase [Bryobacterales bacterium]|nr:protoporphyrinogen oxidase [Bryobacterales bacterium]
MIAIVGGGISGLAAAYQLAKAGKPAVLIEKNPRLGGVIETSSWEGCVLEGGPDSFLAVKPEAAQLARELGMGDELIASNDDRRLTYIWKNRRMIAMPDGMMMMIPTKIAPVITTPLLSWPTKIRMGLEYFRRPRGPRPERSVSEFIGEHYGQETVDYLAEPLLSGVYGGDPRALSVNAVLTRFVDMETKYGSLTRAALEARKKMPASSEPLFRTFKHGLGAFTAALERAIEPHTRVIHGTVDAIEKGWRLRVNGEWIAAEKVILATPAYAAASLLTPLDTELGRLLDTVDYSSSLTIALVFRPGRLPDPKGFGFLVPKKERRMLMAGTWVQNKFPHRAPDGYHVLRGFIGGAAAKEMIALPDDVIYDAVYRDIEQMLGIRVKADHQRITRWRRSMAQYTVGHTHRIRQVEQRTQALENLYLAGNAYSGIGIPDCIRTGRLAAERCVVPQ